MTSAGLEEFRIPHASRGEPLARLPSTYCKTRDSRLTTHDSTRRIVRMKKSVFVCAEQVNRASLRLGSFFSILNVEWIRCCSGATRRRPYKTADSRHRGEQKRTKVATERTQAHSLFVRLSLSFSLSFCLLERD